MEKQTIFFVMGIVLTVLYGWTVQQNNEIKKAAWLVGTWENKTSRGTIYETWSKKSDHQLSGISYIVKEKDSIIFENIEILQDRTGLSYIPTVNNQNGGLPVRFIAKKISDNQLEFENLQHDFPQTISYKKITADSLVAFISGIKNGQFRSQSFPMKKIN